mgnify:FL=1
MRLQRAREDRPDLEGKHMRFGKWMGGVGLAAVILSGCAGSPAGVSMESPEQLRTEDLITLCRAYGQVGGEQILAELLRRKAVEQADVPLIHAHEIKIGMGLCGLLAAWGIPSYAKSKTTLRAERDEYVYDRGYRTRQRVYLRDGIITGFQDIE